MSNGILYVSCGAPGSGKSTFLREMKDPNEVIISRDDIRFSILKPGEAYFAHEKEVYFKFIDTIVKHIRNGINVYADATHLNTSSRYKLLKSISNRGCKPKEINAIYFNVPLNICIERNNLRKGTKTFVPEKSLEEMFCAYTFPAKYEGFNNIWEVNSEGDVSEIE